MRSAVEPLADARLSIPNEADNENSMKPSSLVTASVIGL